jgi:hypothetical protein
LSNAPRPTTAFGEWRLRPLVAAIVAAGAFAPEAARTATLTVTTLAESSGSACTLRDALNSVNKQADQGQCAATGAYGANDTVVFAPAVIGTVTFVTSDPLSANPAQPSALVVKRATVIQGPGSALLTLNCGNVAARLLEVDATGSAVSVDGVTISNCRTVGAGGGVLVNTKSGQPGPTVSLTDVTLSGNRAVFGGGLALLGSNTVATVTLTACSVVGNVANLGGGGLYASKNSVAVVDSVVTQNIASFGGGAMADSPMGDITFTRATISNNVASGGGGEGGGGIYVQGNAAASVLDSTIANNQAQDTGGGVLVSRGSFRATNSTLSGNSAGDMAGAIYMSDGTVLMLANSTIAANASTLGAAVEVTNAMPTITIVDTIIAGNQPVPDIESNPGGASWDISYSIIGQPGTITLVGAGNQTGGAVPPPFGAGGWLGPLQDNGGPTQTHALLTNVPNPAVDAGDPAFSGLAYDQRGPPFLRVRNGRVDVGAYEVQVGSTTAAPVPGPNRLVLGLLSGLLGLLGWKRHWRG